MGRVFLPPKKYIRLRNRYLSSSILYTEKKLLQPVSFTVRDHFNSKGLRELLGVLKPSKVFKNIEKPYHRFHCSHSKNIILPSCPVKERGRG